MRRLHKPAGGSVARALVCIGLLCALVVLSGCATNKSYPNNPKPPATKTISVIVGGSEIAASPNPFGAGPTRFVITNQTGAKQIVSINTDRFERKVPVDVDQTANFKVDTEPGFLSIDGSNTAANALEINVGPKRPSAQQDLNQP